MQGCRAGTGAAGTICSEPKSESDIKSGAATAPRKDVRNSYQTYRTTSSIKWTNFRLKNNKSKFIDLILVLVQKQQKSKNIYECKSFRLQAFINSEHKQQLLFVFAIDKGL